MAEGGESDPKNMFECLPRVLPSESEHSKKKLLCLFGDFEAPIIAIYSVYKNSFRPKI